MIVSCLLNDKIGPAAHYTLEFILNNRGIFFEWVRKPESGRICIVYEEEIKAARRDKGYLYLPCRYDLASLHHTDLTWQELKLGQACVPVAGMQVCDQEVPFDLLATVYYHLTRIGENSCNHPDDIDHDIQAQLLYRYGRFKIPVVDMLCCWFADIIENMQTPLLKKALYPSGEVCGVAVTHDVDRIHAIHPVKKWFRQNINWPSRSKSEKSDRLEQEEQRIWNFDRLVSDYQERGIKATLFFLAKKMERGSYRYDIRMQKFRLLFDFLIHKKHEVALHASRYAFNKRKRYLKEKRQLDRAIGDTITGIRQHYLRCLFPQLWRIAAEMGLLYDSSLVYRRSSGFRAGTGHPFSCYDYAQGTPLPLIECPVLFFENTLPNEGIDPETSIAEITSLFEQVKTYQGVMVALWHQDNLYENEPYSAIWRKFLELIDRDIMYIETLQGQAKWYTLRNQIKIKQFRQEEDDWRITLILPEYVTKFTLILPEGIDRVDISDIHVDYRVKNRYLTIDIKKQIQILDIKLS